MIAGRAAASTPLRGHALAALLMIVLAASGCEGEPTAATPSCADAPVLVPGSPMTGTLGTDDRRRGGAFIDYYGIHPPGPSTARIELTSASFDPFLLLFDEAGRPLEQAFGPEPGDGLRTATLTGQLERGCYLVGASSWHPDATGGYFISLQLDDPLS